MFDPRRRDPRVHRRYRNEVAPTLSSFDRPAADGPAAAYLEPEALAAMSIDGIETLRVSWREF